MTRNGWVMWVACLVGGCGDDGDDKMATATIAPTTGNTVTGTATFTASGADVSVTVTVANAPVGMHGMHIHQVAACGNDGADAGGHWDGGTAAGDAAEHGLPGGAQNHLGDLGNITIAADGTGTLMASNAGWKLGDGSAADVVGHSVIFHTSMDDGTMPSAGARMGCGIIAAD